MRHGSLNSLFQVALHVPSYDREDLDNGVDRSAVAEAAEALQREAVRVANDEQVALCYHFYRSFFFADNSDKLLADHSDKFKAKSDKLKASFGR